MVHPLRRPHQYLSLWFTLPSRIRKLREQGTVHDWVDFAFSSPFTPLQVRREITELLEFLVPRRPKTILEIGTAAGGTLLLLTLAAAPSATVVSVDMPRGKFGGYHLWEAPYFRRFVVSSQRLELLRADSHSFSTLQSVRGILAGRPLDVLFIDGDHTYGGAKADWEMYSPLMSPDGLVAFHDIVPQPPEAGCEVHILWQELKGRFKHHSEIVANPGQMWTGIGVLWPRDA